MYLLTEDAARIPVKPLEAVFLLTGGMFKDGIRLFFLRTLMSHAHSFSNDVKRLPPLTRSPLCAGKGSPPHSGYTLSTLFP